MGDVVPLPLRGQPLHEQDQPAAPGRTSTEGEPDQREPRRDGVEPLWRESAGRELRRERQASGRRLVDVAEDAGVSPQYLSEVERGLKDPSSELLAAMAGALGLSVADLASRVASAGKSRRTPLCLAA
jgi:DNA-binding XRE family transcriptional regulator